MPAACPARRGLRAAAVAAVAAVALANCSPDQVTQPDPSGAPPDLGARAIAVHVDVAAGTATVLDPTGRPTSTGVSLALLGANEISATIGTPSRSAVGQFIAKKVRITFGVALTNRSIAALLPPTFPTPPAGNTSVMLFPFATTLTAGSGAIAGRLPRQH